MAGQKLMNDISNNFTNNEVLRIIDLCIRRVKDYGEEEYTEQEQRMFNKLRDIIMIKYGCGQLGTSYKVKGVY